MPERDPALFFVQRLRDEAHRFAIGTHRARRKKEFVKSPLDEIPGIGPASEARAAARVRHREGGRAGGSGGSGKDAGTERGDGEAGVCVLPRGGGVAPRPLLRERVRA